jgi:phytoene synthase
MDDLARSYQTCRQLVRESNSNFAWTFRTLSPERRSAMEALYAFARHSDDLADESGDAATKRLRFAQWRSEVEQALVSRSEDPLLPALADSVRRFEIPERYLFEVLDGVEQDLDPQPMRSFEDLRRYCYLVASSVGLACIHVWGFTSDDVFPPATECGIAFQLTNILRDLGEDLRAGRCYLPLDELARFDLTAESLAAGENRKSISAFLQFQCRRAAVLYEQAAATERYLLPEGQRIFRLMFDTYRALLSEIERRGIDVLHSRTRLGWTQKLSIARRLATAIATGS